MEMTLSLKEKEVVLVLRDGDTVVDKRLWKDDNNLLEVFFPTLDHMLLQCGKSIGDIKYCDLDSDMPSGYTTARIAQTIIRTLNFACKA